MITLTIIAFVILLLLAGAFAIVQAAIRAPDGYEDDDGFHAGPVVWPPEVLKAVAAVAPAPDRAAPATAGPVREEYPGADGSGEPWPQELEPEVSLPASKYVVSHAHGVH
ncbi:MAG: hypothetical protein A3G75_09855 [Verrucomicrobia bacterium RIFCSPLOWO2_12_FULL_64_8]|nr:MAG: hypothetical protein A3G75_09855 [Verrucomicrobia bacterium RIFCSPLOWO2_12_FULL_64_8]